MKTAPTPSQIQTAAIPAQAAAQIPAVAAIASKSPPPPRCNLLLICGFLFAAVFLIAPPAAQAQTLPTFTLTGPPAIAEGETATYRVTHSGPAYTGTLGFSWTYTAGTAAAADFQGSAAPTGDNLLFTAGTATATEQTFTITIADDAIAEPGKTFTVALAKVGLRESEFAVAPTGGIMVTITDDDTMRALAVTGPDTIAEGGSATYTVTLTGDAFYAAAAITWRISGDTTGVTPATGTVNFATTDMTGATETFDLSVADNAVADNPRAFTIALTDPMIANTRIGAALPVSIADDDASISITAPASAAVGDTAVFTVTRRGASAAAVTVTYDVSGVVTDSGSLEIAAGQTSGAISIDIPANALDSAGSGSDSSGNAMLTVTLTGATAASGGGTATVSTTSGMASVTVAPAADTVLHEMILPEATRAVVGQQMSALVERVGAAGGVGNLPSFSLNGQSSFASVAAANARALANGDGVDAKTLLRDLDFVMPLSAGVSGGSGAGSLAFWGSADYHDFSGEDGDSDWDGDITSFHLGVDGQVRDNLLAGVMVSYSDSESEYSQVAGGNTQTGEYELDLTSVSPYLNWNFANDSAAWASVSYGSGEVEVAPDGGAAASNDINMQSVAFGGSRRLQKIGARELRLKADVFVAQAEVEGDAGGLPDDLEIDANRARVALRFVAGGSRLTRAFDFGARHDGGDGRAGTGMEIGGEVAYRHARLTLQGRARALLAHSGDQRGWGVGGLFRVAAGADGQGLSLSVAPSYGNAGVGTGTVDSFGDSAAPGSLWNNGLATAVNAAADLSARLDAEIGYGLPSKLTPYSAMRLGDERRDYRLGLRWSTAQRLDLDLSARRTNADDAVTLQGRWRF